MEFEKLFSGEIKPGLYRVPYSTDLSNLKMLSEGSNFALFLFNGDRIYNLDDFLDQFEELMQPPEHGRNWNSFEEHFRISDWINAKWIIVIYKDFENFMRSSKGDFEVMLDIFNDMMVFRNKHSDHPRIVPFYIFFQGDDNVTLPMQWW